ncbi:hypothetical protein [Psychroserpens sp. Hel_I_66]|uniref:hypothetical protein n=1 Tax=Psychroserpens sp. Hel_I_66 TaxID=1250004 RepID=UPI0006481087|nr:hypothetical protein [Psychroserpens sp. Hel_I_66]
MMTFISLVCGIAVLFCLYVIFRPKTKEEKEYDRRLEESLKDEFIIDPETGAKITLEEAESGHWVNHNNEFRTIPESDLKKLTEDEKQAEIALNYLRESRAFRKTELTDEQFDIFDKTKTLNSYDDWTYSNPFSFQDGILILPAPELHGMTYYQDDYKESHVMFWKKIYNTNGHYYLREKSATEKLFDKIRNDDDLQLKDYESFTFKRSYDIIKINKILEKFENQKGLEIEINDDNLFIKTLKLISLEDIKRIEKILNNIR